MKIVHVAAELAPIAKIGGLADVLQGLPAELVRQGHTVEVWVPPYSWLSPQVLAGYPFVVRALDVPNFDGSYIYGADDVERFAHFSRAAAELARKESYDVMHVHDWHTACIARWVPRVVLTLHNLSYFGACSAALLERIGCGLDPRYQGPEGYSLLRVGLVHAAAITTVSPTYAQQILSPEYGYGFAAWLQQRGVTGILNGIDEEYWDPHMDRYLYAPYHADCCRGKQDHQKEFCERHGVPQLAPIVASIARLVWQKGIEALESAVRATCEMGGVYLLLGSVSDMETQEKFIRLQQQYGNHLFLQFASDEALAHRVYGAADLFVVPSRFEPCGLTQLIAMRYGAVPIVHATGGLADSIEHQVTGFTFSPYDPNICYEVCKTSVQFFRDQPVEWRALQERGMKRSVGWKASAQAYSKLYLSCCSGVTGDAPCSGS